MFIKFFIFFIFCVIFGFFWVFYDTREAMMLKNENSRYALPQSRLWIIKLFGAQTKGNSYCRWFEWGLKQFDRHETLAIASITMTVRDIEIRQIVPVLVLQA